MVKFTMKAGQTIFQAVMTGTFLPYLSHRITAPVVSTSLARKTAPDDSFTASIGTSFTHVVT